MERRTIMSSHPVARMLRDAGLARLARPLESGYASMKLLLGVIAILEGVVLLVPYVANSPSTQFYLNQMMPPFMWTVALVLHGLVRVMRALYDARWLREWLAIFDTPLALCVWAMALASCLALLIGQPKGLSLSPLSFSGSLALFAANVWFLLREQGETIYKRKS